MSILSLSKGGLFLAVMLAVSGCEQISNIANDLRPNRDKAASDTAASTTGTEEERDVEAPDVFQETAQGLWDGRPSLGGVWVAHPNVSEPERVLIRNDASGEFVIGALFRRERDTPGPLFQVSSDAASSLGMLAGQPTALSVTALRREKVPVAAPEAAPIAESDTIETAGEIDTAPLDPIASASAAAIDQAESDTREPLITPAEPAPADTADTATTPAPVLASNLEKPFVQIGIFSVQANANATGDTLRAAGIVPTILDQESSGKRFWRVVVGPATSSQERGELLQKVRKLGYADAYFVTN